MGMAASQATLGFLTARNHTIGGELEQLSSQKRALTRDAQKLTKEYNEALQTKTLKWSNNNGVNYTDLTYSTLMRPNAFNQYNPILLTDSAGKVVIDHEYLKYAEMISSDGKAGGDYKSNRNAILTALIPGLTTDALDNETALSEKEEAAREAKDDAYTAMRDVKYETMGKDNLKEFLLKQFKDAPDTKIKTVDELKIYAGTVKTKLNGYLLSDDQAKIDKIVDDYVSTQEKLKDHFVETTADKVIDAVLANIFDGGNSISELTLYTDGNNSTVQKYLDAKAIYDQKESEYETIVNESNQVFTKDVEMKIDFYDRIFTAVAENGWKSDYMVSDQDYLDQMLQNNEYLITTMVKNDNSTYWDSNNVEKQNSEYTYNTDLALNTDNIFIVNDENKRQEALVDYEYKKSLISEKESRVDTRMKNLETEQKSINSMIESIKKAIENNVDSTFKIFS